MSSNLSDQLALLPHTLGNHLTLSVAALLAGIAISLPLAIGVSRHVRLRALVLATAGIIQTVPGLALLALMVPVLAGVGLLTGLDVPVLGFAPTVIALTLYSVLPVLRNTVTGLAGIDPDLTEAALALGMTPRQMLWRVELPLAAPVILAGIRTATVWVVGTATLATPVGQVCLGNHIFMGLQTRNWTAVLLGCVAAAALAISLDSLIGGLERAARDDRPGLAVTCTATLVLLVGAGLLAPRLAAARSGGDTVGGEPVRVGTKTFTEQYVLGDLTTRVLDDAGFPVERVDGLGSTIIFDALRTGEVDVYVDYSGTIWANHMQRRQGGDRLAVLDEVTRWLRDEHGIICLGSLGFENAYALALPRRRAVSLGLATIGDLVRHAPEMTIGGDYEFFGRPEWRAVRDGYGLSFGAEVSYDATFMYGAVVRGEADVISAFSSDGRISAFDLAVLEDTLGVIPPYDAVLLVSAAASRRPGLVGALRPLVGAIDVEAMRRANHRVDRDDDKQTVAEAAQWLGEHTGILQP